VSFKTRYTRSPHSIREVIHARKGAVLLHAQVGSLVSTTKTLPCLGEGAVLLHAQVGRIRTERRRRQRRQ